MKLSIRRTEEKQEPEEEVEIELYLEGPDSSGEVLLRVHRKGSIDFSNCLMKFYPSGRVCSIEGIAEQYPFDKDKTGRLAIDHY